MSDIITCSKCNGSGKFIYKSGMTGPCYQCNGKGSVKRIAHKSFAISIMNNDGVRIDWLHISARSQNEAVRKARATAARGCYKDQLDTITATESGTRYFRQNSTPKETWVPSISWSTALPISCSRPARLAVWTSAPSSAAIIPAMWLTSMECCSTFWP